MTTADDTGTVPKTPDERIDQLERVVRALIVEFRGQLGVKYADALYDRLATTKDGKP